LPETLLQRVLNYVRETAPDQWGPVWAAILTRTGKRLCDQITKGLLEGGQQAALAGALLTAVERPTASPDLLGWLWRTMHTSGPLGQFLGTIAELPVRTVAGAMFSLLDSAGKLYGMSMEEKHLKQLEAARAAMGTQTSRPLLALIDEADRDQRIGLKAVIEQNHGLSPAHRTQLLGYLRSRQADIFMGVTREWEEAGNIYTTEGGMRSMQNALRAIIEVEIPEVARQIGEAASHGDLSENAEYTAALEKRDQLASRAARLESELGMAKVINHEMAGSDFVNIGTRVTVRPVPEGPQEIFTFLGPWDTDVQGRVLNYQAPLALVFMGARIGQVVAFETEVGRRSWEILAIEPAPDI
jgi:transcription elongation factor GreA